MDHGPVTTSNTILHLIDGWTRGNQLQAGEKVNANMDGFGYGEAEELQTHQEVGFWNGICVV